MRKNSAPRNARTVALPERDLGVNFCVYGKVYRREVLSVELEEGMRH